jgi:hypothetical protein
MNLGRIGPKANHHPGGVTTEIPYRFANHRFGSARQTIEVRFRIVKAFAFDAPVTNIGPLHGR